MCRYRHDFVNQLGRLVAVNIFRNDVEIATTMVGTQLASQANAAGSW
jgi:hypothetical protein